MHHPQANAPLPLLRTCVPTVCGAVSESLGEVRGASSFLKAKKRRRVPKRERGRANSNPGPVAKRAKRTESPAQSVQEVPALRQAIAQHAAPDDVGACVCECARTARGCADAVHAAETFAVRVSDSLKLLLQFCTAFALSTALRRRIDATVQRWSVQTEGVAQV